MEKELKCDDCGRFIGKAYGTVVAELKCGNSKCKKMVQIKVIAADQSKDLRHKFVQENK